MRTGWPRRRWSWAASNTPTWRRSTGSASTLAGRLRDLAVGGVGERLAAKHEHTDAIDQHSIGASITATLTADQLVLGTVVATGSLAVPAFRVLAPPWLVGAAVSAMWPAATVYAFGVSSAIIYAIVALRWRAIMRGKLV